MANILLVRRPNIICSDNVRALVVRASTVQHLSTVEIAETFQLTPRTVDRILERFHLTGDFKKKKQGGYKPKL